MSLVRIYPGRYNSRGVEFYENTYARSDLSDIGGAEIAGFDSRTWCHVWVEFVVGSHHCSKGFPPQKPTFKFQFDWEIAGHMFVSCKTVLSATLVKQS